MAVNKEGYRVVQVDLNYLDEIESIASLSKDGIVPNKRMIYYLGCTIFKKYSYVVTDHSHTVGFLITFPEDNGKSLWVHQVAVVPQYRGEGIGSLLMNKLLQTAKDNKLSAIRLAVNPANPAIQWYSRLGFEIEGEAAEIGMTIMKRKL